MLKHSIYEVLGVELILMGENRYCCHYCLLNRKGNLIEIGRKASIEGTLVQVLASMPKNCITALNLSGKGILHKNVSVDEQKTQDEVFSTAFPSVQFDDFYVQHFVTGQNGLVHIIRKSLADPVLETFLASGLNVYVFSLGASVTSCIWNLLDLDDTHLSFQVHQFKLDKNFQLLEYSYNSVLQPTPVQSIAGQDLDAEYLIAYAAAFQLLLHKQVVLLSANVQKVNESFENFVQDWVLKKKAFMFLCVLFVSLMLSFFVFNHYNDENAALSGKAGTLAATESQLELYKRNIVEDEALLKRVNWNGGYAPDFVLKEIGSTCPKQLSLLKISMNPILKDKAEEQPVILIAGLSSDLMAVNNWLFVLKEKQWVKSVKLLGYGEEAESGNYKFNLKILY